MNKAGKKVSKPFDFGLFITVMLLLAFGIIMVLSASAPYSLTTTNNSYFYVKRQLGSAVIGFVLMMIISFIDYRKYKKWTGALLVISFLLLVAVLIPRSGCYQK